MGPIEKDRHSRHTTGHPLRPEMGTVETHIRSVRRMSRIQSGYSVRHPHAMTLAT